MWRRLKYMLSPQLDLYNSIAKKVEGLTVLDVGFGTGFGTLQLTRTAKMVTGFEIDEEAVRFASQTIPAVDWDWWNILNPIVAIDRYDAIVMVEVLEHIEDWHTALDHAHRMLDGGGKLYITAKNRNKDYLRGNDAHEREWTAGEFQDALLRVFSVVSLFDYTLENRLDPSTRVTPLIAVCEK